MAIAGHVFALEQTGGSADPSRYSALRHRASAASASALVVLIACAATVGSAFIVRNEYVAPPPPAFHSVGQCSWAGRPHHSVLTCR